ncbi:hypothetical protein MTO96_026496 [Rhipicephalus appendiculatus]
MCGQAAPTAPQLDETLTTPPEHSLARHPHSDWRRDATTPWPWPPYRWSGSQVFSSGEAASDTVSPSAYTRNIAAITRETTVIDRTRERFIVIAMSTLLLLISLTLFGILYTLLSEDWILRGVLQWAVLRRFRRGL